MALRNEDFLCRTAPPRPGCAVTMKPDTARQNPVFQEESMTDFRTLVEQARSCRRFVESEPLTMKDLDWLIDCARLTPSARNQQALRYSLITQGDVCDALFAKTSWAAALKDWGGPQPGERPTAFIAISLPGNAGHLTWVDLGIVVQTIQLAATSRSWGCCIIASFDVETCRTLCRIPEELSPRLVLGLGKAAETRVIEPVPADGKLSYWRDADGVHHVPKLALDQLVIGRFQGKNA